MRLDSNEFVRLDRWCELPIITQPTRSEAAYHPNLILLGFSAALAPKFPPDARRRRLPENSRRHPGKASDLNFGLLSPWPKEKREKKSCFF